MKPRVEVAQLSYGPPDKVVVTFTDGKDIAMTWSHWAAIQRYPTEEEVNT